MVGLTKKYENGEELKLNGTEALAFLCGIFSNATHNNYDAERLFDRVESGFTLKVKKSQFSN